MKEFKKLMKLTGINLQREIGYKKIFFENESQAHFKVVNGGPDEIGGG